MDTCIALRTGIIHKNKLLGTSTVDGSELSFTPEQITMIDGMEPKRLCNAYKIKV